MVVVVLLVIVVPGFAFGVLELLALVLFGLAVWGSRVVFRRPWRVRHLVGEETAAEVSVVGWRRAHRVMVEAADELRDTGGTALAFAPHGVQLG